MASRFSSIGALLLAACGTRALLSEQGQVQVVLDGVATDYTGGVSAGGPVLVGTALCGELRAASGSGIDPTCFVVGASGAGELDDDGCLAVTAPGEAAWTLDAAACATGVDDRVVVEGVSPASVAARLEFWPEEAVLSLAEEEPDVFGRAPPDGWLPAPGGRVQVVEGGRLELPVLLEHGSFDDPVAWSPSRGALTVGGVVDDARPGWAALGADEGPAVLALDGASFPVADVVLVPASAIVSLEIVVARLVGEEGSQPLGARAVAFDAAGEPVFGAPVAWSLSRGAAALVPGDDLPGPDYLGVHDACVPSGKTGRRSIGLVAVLEGLRARADLSWTRAAGDHPSEEDPACVSGCGCASTSARGGWLGVGLLGVGLRRRRR